MSNFFREQPKLRLFFGGAASALMWGLFIVRVAAGIGPMHDADGNQAPAFHYLAGAVLVTLIAVGWLLVGAALARREQEQDRDR